MKTLFILLLTFSFLFASSQAGILRGSLLDDKGKVLADASVQLISLADTISTRSVMTDKAGTFFFEQVAFGYYRLRMSYVGLQSLMIDSLHFRNERADFNLVDLVLKPRASSHLQEVIVYAEKPLIQSKDGNITFNVAESALAVGSNASELLSSTPLVTKDANGRISVRGKEPRILIDDKPVELNLQQLQDLLESLPGSAIEKIEVMMNPPPQYANEQGGVINIVTKKGRVGKTGRISLSAGTRGEVSVNGNFTYRKQGLSISLNAGSGYNLFEGNGHSARVNLYTDSSNFLNTRNEYVNKSLRPNFRFNMDYDMDKFQSLNVVLQLNANDYLNRSGTEYRNLNRFGDTYRLSERVIRSDGNNVNGSLNVSYLMKTKMAGEQLRVTGSTSHSLSEGDRDFYQQYFNPDRSPNGIDSTQEQLTDNRSTGFNTRLNYDRPLFGQKTFLSVGGFYNRSNSDIEVNSAYLRKPDAIWVRSDLLSNDFRFHQTIWNLRSSLRQVIAAHLSVTGGLSLERTNIWFELLKEGREAKNHYQTWLPFANINKNWQDQLNITLSYRRSIRRPGINELNPTIDFSDPYNTRFGNEKLEASTADNFDMVLGYTKQQYYINIGAGYNKVKDIFSQVRTLLPDGKTQITWENISGRKEYEVSTWGGLTINKKMRVNISASYTYNSYSVFDRSVNRYRNGGSFTSNSNVAYSPTDLWNLTGSFTINRFANPQGFARWNWSMNAGIQRKFFEKRLTVTVNVIDPFIQQQNRNYTYGSNFILQSFNATSTRNFRLSIGYNLIKLAKKNALLDKIKAG